MGDDVRTPRSSIPIQAIPRILQAWYSHIPWSCRNHYGTLSQMYVVNKADQQVSSEWWAWEACALAASMLGPVSLAAQSCLLSTTSTFFQVPASLGIASAVRTGNLLGAGRGWEAKWASRTSLIMSIFFSACNRSVSPAIGTGTG